MTNEITNCQDALDFICRKYLADKEKPRSNRNSVSTDTRVDEDTALIKTFKKIRRQSESFEVKKFAQALDKIPADDREQWINISLSIKSGVIEGLYSDKIGFKLFVRYSKKSHKYNAADMEDRWAGLKPDGSRTVDSIWFAAHRIDPLFAIADNLGKTRQSSIIPIDALSLMNKEFPDKRWIVDELITEGLTNIAGPAKLGKSWLALHIALSVSAGSNVFDRYKTKQGKVLYLALEDNEKRIKDRINRLTSDSEIGISKNLIVSCSLAKANYGGLNDLEKWLKNNPDCILIIIDTLARFKSTPGKNSGTAYDSDTAALSPIQELAIKNNIAVIAITHTTKAKNDDPFNKITGSTGIQAIADANWVIERQRGQNQAKLVITGRDIEEQELAIEFNSESCKWRYLGDAYKYQISQERLAILDYLEESGAVAGPTTIAEAIGADVDNVKVLLIKMYSDGQIGKSGKGKYFALKAEEVFKNV